MPTLESTPRPTARRCAGCSRAFLDIGPTQRCHRCERIDYFTESSTPVAETPAPSVKWAAGNRWTICVGCAEPTLGPSATCCRCRPFADWAAPASTAKVTPFAAAYAAVQRNV
jgi:hypothetical protein